MCQNAFDTLAPVAGVVPSIRWRRFSTRAAPVLLIPVSTEVHDGKIRMAALLMMGLCLGVHLLVSGDASRAEDRVRVMVDEFQRQQHWTPPSPENIPSNREELEALRERAQTEQRRAMEGLVQEVHQLRKGTLMYRLGLTPARLHIVNLLTYMFVHGGWMHLLGNMLFFYVCGVAMEKYWGFWRFLLSYLVCGAIAGLFYMGTTIFAHEGVREIPLVGASGAIAGAMGAFVVTHTKVKVKMFYLIAFWWRGTFGLPSYVYFGLWFVMQIVASAVEPEHSSGVAYSAHIGGFLVGALLGAFIKSEDEAALVVPNRVAHSLRRRQGAPRAVLPESVQPAAGPQPSAATQFGGAPLENAPQESPAGAGLVAQGEAALRQGDVLKASSLLTRAVDHYFQGGDQRRGELVVAVKFVMENNARLAVPAAQIYQWAKGLLSVGLFPPAIACFDTAAAAADSPHLRNNSLLGASVTRLRVGIQRDRARSDLERVAADGASGGLFAHEARRILQESFGAA
ncbi:MAG: rhomboid family intramembrane serine protease [Chitinivibrionales bacterium]|nr:rhomboid family intramembrane serine protease [Chitinivibrionales bacterium]